MSTTCSATHQPADHTTLAWITAGVAWSAGVAAIAAATGYYAHRRMMRRRAGPAGAALRSSWFSVFFAPANPAAAAQRPAEPPRSGEHAEGGPQPVPTAFADVDGPDVPEAFTDPITFAAMHDPAVLCGTGQVCASGL
jgi:hypothetical protein